MKDNGKMDNVLEKVLMYGEMEKCIKDNGKGIK